MSLKSLLQKAGRAVGPRNPEVSSRQANLVTETEEIAFTAEGRFLEASFYTGGLMKIPREVKEVRADTQQNLKLPLPEFFDGQIGQGMWSQAYHGAA